MKVYLKDKVIYLYIMIFFIISFFGILQASIYKEENIYYKQIIWYLLGILIIYLLKKINIKKLYKLSLLFYFLNIILLIGLFFFGSELNNSKSWYIIYGISLILSDYLEFDYIYKYLQNNTLHVIREIIFMSLFNFVLMLLLLPRELPYLFTEETDLKKCEYLLSDLNQKNILEVNDREIKNIKKQLDKKDNVQIILVNPFFGNKNQNDKFEQLHLGNATSDSKILFD